MGPRRSLVALAGALLLASCAESPTLPPTTSGTSGADVSASSRGASSHPEATVEALMAARERLVTAPPKFHGVYELQEANEPEGLRWEVWVRWPAFRVETTDQGGPLVLATLDGKLISYRQGDEVGTSNGFEGPGAIVLGPPVFQLMVREAPHLPCDDEEIRGIEEVAGRPTIHVICPHEGSESWVDSVTGLILARFNESTGPGGDGTGRFTWIEFAPDLDDAMFDATSG
jgi:hypothetical protein